MPQKRKRVEFTMSAPDAKQVMLAGTFNQWSENSDPMKQDRTGTWKKVKFLFHGKYEYKFIADGEWIVDPDAKSTVPNQFGTQNNVMNV